MLLLYFKLINFGRSASQTVGNDAAQRGCLCASFLLQHLVPTVRSAGMAQHVNKCHSIHFEVDFNAGIMQADR